MIGILSAFLLFLALRAQVEANSLVSTQLKEQRDREYIQKMTGLIMQQISMIREDIDSFQFTQTKKKSGEPIETVTYHGIEAFQVFLDFATSCGRQRDPTREMA